jgi:hypothetical protein
MTQKVVREFETLVGLKSHLRDVRNDMDIAERQRVSRQRDADALIEAEKRVEASEARQKAAEKKNAEEQSRIQARIKEEAEALRIAREDGNREAERKHKEYMVEQEKREKERQKEFERKRKAFEADVERRKEREAAIKQAIAVKIVEVPRIPVEEAPTVSAMDVLKQVQKAVLALTSALELTRSIKQNDLLLLKRIKTEAEVAQKLSGRLVIKFQKA